MAIKLKRMWPEYNLNSSYDAVIIGGGIHGCATAYYLAKDQGMKNIAGHLIQPPFLCRRVEGSMAMVHLTQINLHQVL